MRRATLLILLMAVMMGFTAAPARASLIVANQGGPITGLADPEGPFFRWYYRVSLTPDQSLRNDSSFTIFDFDGFVGGAMATDFTPATASWAFTSSLLGPHTAPADDGAEFNLTWTYTGPNFSDPTTTTIGTFSALSLYDFDSRAPGYFAANAFTTGGAPMNNVSTLGEIDVPEEPVVTDVVPEPGTMLLLGTGLFAAIARRRRQSQSQI